MQQKRWKRKKVALKIELREGIAKRMMIPEQLFCTKNQVFFIFILPPIPSIHKWIEWNAIMIIRSGNERLR